MIKNHEGVFICGKEYSNICYHGTFYIDRIFDNLKVARCNNLLSVIEHENATWFYAHQAARRYPNAVPIVYKLQVSLSNVFINDNFWKNFASFHIDIIDFLDELRIRGYDGEINRDLGVFIFYPDKSVKILGYKKHNCEWVNI